jgi:hypothetical protein
MAKSFTVVSHTSSRFVWTLLLMHPIHWAAIRHRTWQDTVSHPHITLWTDRTSTHSSLDRSHTPTLHLGQFSHPYITPWTNLATNIPLCIYLTSTHYSLDRSHIHPLLLGKISQPYAPPWVVLTHCKTTQCKSKYIYSYIAKLFYKMFCHVETSATQTQQVFSMTKLIHTYLDFLTEIMYILL